MEPPEYLQRVSVTFGGRYSNSEVRGIEEGIWNKRKEEEWKAALRRAKGGSEISSQNILLR